VLQGYGVTVDLVGSTFIHKGITTSTFKTVPDVPVGSFELYLPQGQYSALTAYGDLCRSRTRDGRSGTFPARIVEVGNTGGGPGTAFGCVSSGSRRAAEPCAWKQPKRDLEASLTGRLRVVTISAQAAWIKGFAFVDRGA
jgi:hypothetical protein